MFIAARFESGALATRTQLAVAGKDRGRLRSSHPHYEHKHVRKGRLIGEAHEEKEEEEEDGEGVTTKRRFHIFRPRYASK